jgi:hemerythrin
LFSSLWEVGYPEVEEHCIYHAQLLERADEIKKMCRDMGDRKQLKKCFDEMVAFFVDDVVKGDLGFISHLMNAGIVKQR